MRGLKGLNDLWETARSVLPLVLALAFFSWWY